MKRIVIASLLVGLVSSVGCSDSNDSTGSGGSSASGGSGGSGGSGASGGSGGSGGASGAGGSTISDAGSTIPTGTCTEPGSVCVTLKLPTATEAPTRLIVGFYTAPLPPLGPPDAVGALIETPTITPGAEISMKMTNVPIAMDGEFSVYAALYMPGGGSFQAKKGVDYEAFTSKKVTVSKTAPTILTEKLEFSLAK